MICNEVVGLLTDYESGHLVASVHQDVQLHLTQCSACARERALLESTWTALQEWPALTPSVDFATRVMEAVASPCNTVVTRLPAYQEQDLNVAEMENIRLHLDRCKPCQAEARLFENSWALLLQWKDTEPSGDFLTRVMQAVDSRPAPVLQAFPTAAHRSLWSRLLPRPGVGSRLVAMAAAFTLTCALFLLHPTPPSSPGGSGTPMQAVTTQVTSVAVDEDLLPMYEMHVPSQNVSTEEILEELVKE